MSAYFRFFALTLLALVGPNSQSSRADIIFPDFSSTAGLDLNGDATQVGNRIRLTPSVGGLFMAGSFFHSTLQQVDAGFTTSFDFQIHAPTNTGADGFTFLIQNSAAGTAALGGVGVDLGYGGIANSLAVEF